MKKLLNFRLIMFIAVSLVLGVVSAYFFICNLFVPAILFTSSFAISLLVYLIFYSSGNRKKSGIFVSVFVIFFTIGVFSFSLQIGNFKNANLGDHYYSVTGKVSEINFIDGGVKLVVKDAFIKGNVTGNLNYKIAVYVYGEKEYELGDLITFESHLKDVSVFYEGRFSPYNVEKGIKYTANVYDNDVITINNDKNVFEKVNVFIKDALYKGLDEKQFSIAYAMLTGNSDYMDAEVVSSYRQSGVAHIFAVSGLHIGFVATVLGYILNKLKVGRVARLLITVPVLLFYSGVCGFSASSIRASVMASVLLLSAIKGDKYDGLTSVSLAMIIVLLISPVQLFCVGFQLSFVVVLGIILLSRPILRLLKFLPQKLAKSLSVVLSAQISSIPVSIYAFGEFSTIAVIMNLLFIPIVGIIFTALFVCLMLGAIFNLHRIFLFLPNVSLNLINTLITAFDYQIFIIGGIMTGGFAFAYYGAIIISSGLINLSTIAKRVAVVVLSLVCAVGSVFVTISDGRKSKLYVCGTENVCATVISTPKTCTMIVSYAKRYYSVSRLSRLRTIGGIDEIDTLIIADGFNVDIHAFVSRLIGVFGLNKIIYCGNKREVEEIAIMKSFPRLQVINAVDGESFSFEDTHIEIELGGCQIDARVFEQKIAVLSAFRTIDVDYARIGGGYDYLITLDSVESVFAISRPKTAISYLIYGDYINAQREGNVCFIL